MEKSDSFKQSVQESVQATEEPVIPEKGLDVEKWPMEQHVLETLREAKKMSDNHPIDARTLLWAALVIEQQTGSTALQKLKEFFTGHPSFPPSKSKGSSTSYVFDLTPPLARCLTYARRSLNGNSRLWGRDLVTSILLAFGDPSLQEVALEADTSAPELQDRWFMFLTESNKHRTREEWEEWWEWAQVPTPDKRNTRAGINNDTTGGKDQLDIQEDVDALSLLITDVKTKPPLSIGLLGDWGSGKSYFMDLMQKKVDELESKPGLCDNVVQIRFNAWHYSDTNIWASLVGHLFEQIWDEMVPEGAPAAERKKLEAKIKEADGALHEVQAELEDAISTLETAEEDREIALNTLAIRGKVRDQSIDTLKELSSIIGWEEPLDAIIELEKAQRSLSDSTVRTQKVLDVALGNPGIRRALLWMTITVFVAAALTFGAEFLIDNALTQQALQTLATIGGIITSLAGGAAGALNRGNSAVKKFKRRLDSTMKEYESYREEGESDASIKQRDEEIRKARLEVERLEASIKAARERIESLEFRQLSLNPAQRLRSFLEERATTDDYRAREGIISLVRRDFEKLAELMKDYRHYGDPDEEESEDHITGIDRVVLYIDDLDRCASDIVVRTLEIVHLLLALDLFMVVVAVDSRWLIRALEVHYQDMLGLLQNKDQGESFNDRNYRLSTPQNYLEKIFQITFALAPMSPTGYGKYIDFLTGHEHEGEDEHRETKPGTDEITTLWMGQESLEQGNSTPPESLETDNLKEGQDGGSRPSFPPIDQEEELDPARVLTISDTERAFLKSLSVFVTTPRLAKRMVNVFRLLKSRVSLTELDAFRDESSGRYRPMLLLLSLLYGRPELAVHLFKCLSEGTLRPEKGSPSNVLFHEALLTLSSKKPESTTPSPDDPWSYLAKQVKKVAPSVTLEECEHESIQIARYSIVTGQFWHTWHRMNA